MTEPRRLGAEIRSLAQMLASRASETPARLAFAADGEGLTYGELDAAAAALAEALACRGLGAGDRAVLLLPAGLDFVRAFFALQRLGAVPHPLSPALPPAAAARGAARVRPRLVIGSVAAQLAACAQAGIETAALAALCRDGAVAEAGGGALRDQAAAKAALGEKTAGKAALREKAAGEAVAFLQATSGTSGEARAAIILQRNALASLAAARDHLGIGPADVLVGWVPPWHDLGLLRFILGPVFFGAPCHLVPPAIRTIPRWLRTAAAVRATILGAPDFAYRLAVRMVDPRGLDLSALRYATNGGEAVRRSTIAAFEARFGVPGTVRPGYGLAEATLGVSCLVPGEALRSDAHGNVSCGRVFPGVEIRIVPPSPLAPLQARASLSAGQPGEILVRGPGVFAGYFDAAAESGAVLRDGWLHTGDLGAVDGDGHLYVLGRIRAMIKRGGVPLAPREIEEAAELVPGVRIAAAIGMTPAAAASEEIVVAIEAESGCATPPAELAAAVAGAIAAAIGFAPERLLVLAPHAVARTANGKLRHEELRRSLLGVEAAPGGGDAVLFDSRRPA